MDRVALRQVCIRAVRVFHVNSIPPTPHTRIHLNVALTRTTNERCMCIFQTAILFRKLGSKGCKSTSLTSSLGRALTQAASRRSVTLGGPVSILGQSTWILWWTEWHWDRIFSSYLASPLLKAFRPCSTHVALTRRKSCETQELSKMQCCFEYRRALGRKYFPVFLSFNPVCNDMKRRYNTVWNNFGRIRRFGTKKIDVVRYSISSF